MRYVLCLFWIIFCLSNTALAGEVGFTQNDREFLIRLDERLNQIDKRFEQVDKRFEQIELRISELREDMNKRFEQVDKRFEQVDKRFEELREDMNKRFEQVDQRFEAMIQLMMAIIGAFAGIVVMSIGFAIWDRRSMIRPFETKVKAMEEDFLEDKNRLKKLIEALKQLAREDHKLAAVLRNFALL